MAAELLTIQNTPKVDRLIHKAIREAVRNHELPGKASDYQTFYEHGQWWTENFHTGAQWSVCDALPGEFCFEQVTRGDED